MKNPAPVEHAAQPRSFTLGLTRWAIKQTVFVLILAAALFLSAGGSAGIRDWLFLGLVAIIQVLTPSFSSRAVLSC